MSRRLTLALISLLAAFAIMWFGKGIWLSALGRYLVWNAGERSRADVVVIPGADYVRADVDLETLKEAVRLLRAGKVNGIVMSCGDVYEISGCELAEAALRNGGYSGVRIDSMRTNGLPDEMEAEQLVRYLKDRGVRSAIILLPNYKGHRLGGAYRHLGSRSGVEITVSIQNGAFDPRRWWKSREGQKRFAEEVARRLWLF